MELKKKKLEGEEKSEHELDDKFTIFTISLQKKICPRGGKGRRVSLSFNKNPQGGRKSYDRRASFFFFFFVDDKGKLEDLTGGTRGREMKNERKRLYERLAGFGRKL